MIPSLLRKSKYDCAWVADKPSSRCEKDDEHGIDAEDACLVACGVCEAPAPTPKPSREPTAKPTSAPSAKPSAAPATPVPTVGTVESGCEDSTSWYYGGNPEKGCARVAESLSRCEGKENDHGVLAKDACKATCGTCPTTPTCENSASWFYKEEKRDCDWVAIKPDVRCAKEDDEDVSAHEACPTVCDASCAVADSTSWYYGGKPSKNCDYIAAKTSRCSSKKDDDGIYAYEACPVACADAGEQDRKLLRGAN